MQTGQQIKVKADPDGAWLKADVELASKNGKSLALSIEEGVRVPFGLDRRSGRQLLLLYLDDDGGWRDMVCGRTYQVKEGATK